MSLVTARISIVR